MTVSAVDPTPRTGPALWMLCGSLSLAIMGAITHGIGPRCDWLTIAFARAFFMLLTSLGAAWLAGAKLVVWQPRSLWMRSLSGSFSLVCSFYALTRLPVGEVLTLTNTYPIWILILTCLYTRRVPQAFEWIGITAGMIGVILIEQPTLAGDNLAVSIALISAISTALAMIGLHRLRNVDPRAVVAHFSGVATLVSGVWFLARRMNAEQPLGPFDPKTALMVLGVGIFGTVGQIFLTKAYAAGAPARVSVLALTQVVFGLTLDVLIWGRSLAPSALVGTLLVLGPTAWIIGRSASRPRPLEASRQQSKVAVASNS